MLVHVDGDVIVYRAGFSVEHTFYHVHYYLNGKQETKTFDGYREYQHFLADKEWTPVDYWVETEVVVESEDDAVYNTRSILRSLCEDLQVDPETEVRVYLSGETNFRNSVATILPYKGNRDKAKKPVHAAAVKDYIRRAWPYHVSDGQEADDDMAIAHYGMWEVDPSSTVLATIDKDLNMIPGMHYNFVKKESYVVTPEEGLRNFYAQVLTGDTTDNIPGLAGIGPVRAARLLDGCGDTEAALFRVVREAYRKAHPDDADARLLEVGRLLWIRRRPDEWWNPPQEESDAVHSEGTAERVDV